MNIILCEVRNLKDLQSLSPLITINNILSGVLSIIAFYLTFYVAFLLHRIVLYSVYTYRVVAIKPFGCNTTIKFVRSFVRSSEAQRAESQNQRPRAGGRLMRNQAVTPSLLTARLEVWGALEAPSAGSGAEPWPQTHFRA